jgi:hypothetical protein
VRGKSAMLVFSSILALVANLGTPSVAQAASMPVLTLSIDRTSMLVGETARVTINIGFVGGDSGQDVDVYGYVSGGTVSADPNLSTTCAGFTTTDNGYHMGWPDRTSFSCSASFDIEATELGTLTAFLDETSSVVHFGPHWIETYVDVKVMDPPAVTAAFGSPSGQVGQSMPLTFTVASPANPHPLTSVGFQATLPAGLSVSGPAASTCDGTFQINGADLTLAGASLDSDASCQIEVPVTAAQAGVLSVSIDAPTSAEGGSGVSGSASITVNPAATLAPTRGATPPPTSSSDPSGSDTSGGGLGLMLALALGALAALDCGVRLRRSSRAL